MSTVWSFGDSDGTLQVLTGVDGVAARMGHRLTITIKTWHAEVSWDDDQPSAFTLSADVNSLAIDDGEGGVTPLSAPERVLARSNALKTLGANRFPEITFDANTVEPTEAGFRLTGTLQIHGRRRDHCLDVAVTDSGDFWELSSSSAVRQSDFGIKPFSMMMGSLRVADTVTVIFTATRSKDS